MKAKVTNNRKGPYGVEIAGGGFKFIEPGQTRTVDLANPRGLDKEPDIEFAAVGDPGPPPASLKAKAEKAKTPAPAKKTPARRTSTRRTKASK